MDPAQVRPAVHVLWACPSLLRLYPVVYVLVICNHGAGKVARDGFQINHDEKSARHQGGLFITSSSMTRSIVYQADNEP